MKSGKWEDQHVVTLQELADNPQLREDFCRAVNAPLRTVAITPDNERILRPATWDEPFDYFASDHGWNK